MAQKQTILFLRNATAYENLTKAKEALDGLTHKVGQPVVATYSDGGATKALLAVGKAAATGASSYELIATNADLNSLLSTVNGLETKLSQHEAKIAGTDLGHVKNGGNVVVDSEGKMSVDLSTYAPLASPEFTGAPSIKEGSVPAKGDKSNKLATTGWVLDEIKDKIDAANALTFRGTIGTSGTVSALPETPALGDVYVAVAGCPQVNGENVEAGDMVICTKVKAESAAAEWTVVNKNVDGVVSGPGSSVQNNLAAFDNNSGKLIKDSGIPLSEVAKNTVKVQAGTGLTGGGAIAADVTLNHQAKPEDGTAIEGAGAGKYVSSIKLDTLGHVAGAEFGTLPTADGKVAVKAGDGLDFLGTKFAEATDLGATEVAVEFDEENNKIIGKVNIEVIDGGTY